MVERLPRQIEVPLRMSDAVRAAIERYVSTPQAQDKLTDVAAREFGGIALFATLLCIYVLRPDGTLWCGDPIEGIPFEPLPAEQVLDAIVYGASRFTWLQSLVPGFPSSGDWAFCGVCGGKGRIPLQDSTNPLVCPRCSGLGWEPLS